MIILLLNLFSTMELILFGLDPVFSLALEIFIRFSFMILKLSETMFF